MSPLALSLLVAAALLHAGWNLLARQSADRQLTLYWALAVAALVLAPTLALAWPPPPEALALALASSCFEALYFLALVGAYAAGDFSLVYPVARGSAPLLIALWAALLLGERPTPAAWAGIGLVAGGILLISAPAGRTAIRRPGPALGLALATGLCTSAYSTINKLGVGLLAAPAYTSLFHLGTVLLLTPLLVRSRGRKLFEPWRGAPRRLLAIGLTIAASSALVMTALALEPASYVGAVRELSIIFGALAGWRLLAEPLGARRTLAAAVMFSGLVLIAIRG